MKDGAGTGATDWPTTVMVPLPEGAHPDAQDFRLTDAAAQIAIPAQFEIASRRAVRDASIRWLMVHFQATVPAGGTRDYRLTSDSPGPPPASPVRVVNDAPAPGYLEVTTGPLRFTVNKTAFNILDTVWLDLDGDGSYESGSTEERILQPSASNGGRFDGCSVTGTACAADAQNDAALGSPDVVTIEESGPVRAVIRIERFTRYNGRANHKHGYVVRLYAYAGKPWVKVDYQLVNAATDDNGNQLDSGKFANPLYFRALNLDFALNVPGPVTLRTSTVNAVDTRALDANGVEFATTDANSAGPARTHDEFVIRQAAGSGTKYATCVDTDADGTDTDNDCATPGFLDVSNGTWGVQAVYRNYWQLFPSGLEAMPGPRLQIQMWPAWGSQWYYNGSVQNTSLYWLGDMRAAYKEVLLGFHGPTPSDASLISTAKNFQRYPVPSVELAAYRSAETLDFGKVPATIGAVSAYAPASYQTGPVDIYDSGDLNENGQGYRVGWERWYTDSVPRLTLPCDTGNGPASALYFIASASPRHYWNAERYQIQELNGRPAWMGKDYTYADDWVSLHLMDGYCTGTWRDAADTASFPIAPSAKTIAARDHAHNWSYHAQDAYWLTGNLWAKDWMAFLGEYTRAKLRGDYTNERYWRARAHLTKDAINAYHVTGNTTLLREAADFFWTVWQQKRTWCGTEDLSPGSSGQGSLQMGYMQRTSILMLDQLKGYDWKRWAQVLMAVAGSQEANYEMQNFVYSWATLTPNAACGVNSNSSPTGWPMYDTTAWYYWNTGLTRFKTRIEQYFTEGIGTGNPGYCADNVNFNIFPCEASDPTSRDFADAANHWNGAWPGRMFYWVHEQTRSDAVPPAAPTNVAASLAGGVTTVSWSAPSGGPAYYLAVACDKPISATFLATQSATATACNWWAGLPNATTGTTLQIATGAWSTVYAAVFAFDVANNMSAMSAVAQATNGPPVPPGPPQGLRAQ